jgi:uncharacterized cupin superfamily protein
LDDALLAAALRPPATLGPGDVAVFPKGWRGPWELHETVRKIYVIF